MTYVPRERMGPPPRSLATDAHDCIMVRMLQASTEYKVVGRCSPNDGRLASDCLVRCCAGRPPPPWTRDGRSASADRPHQPTEGLSKWKQERVRILRLTTK